MILGTPGKVGRCQVYNPDSLATIGVSFWESIHLSGCADSGGRLRQDIGLPAGVSEGAKAGRCQVYARHS